MPHEGEAGGAAGGSKCTLSAGLATPDGGP
jgi:hypothetical protein